MYQALIRLLSPFLVIFLLIEALKKQGGKRFFWQRLGFLSPNVPKDAIWIHCASVGEVKSIERLVKHLLPSENILITTNTPTGARLVEDLFDQPLQHAYLPFDWVSAVKRFIHQIQPKALWVVETEIWPNLYQQAAKQQIPITLINARISKKTLNAPIWLQKTYRNTLEQTQAILARSESEAERFQKLGANPSRITVIGNLKYVGLTEIHTQAFENFLPNIDYVLLASSHEDEEWQIAKRWQTLNRPEKLVIVPRHPQRAPAIYKQLAQLDFKLGMTSLEQTPRAEYDVFIDDRIGFLTPWYAHAKLVIMGGAFVPAGGHNVLEAAAVKAPIITGPDMSDFIPETQLLQSAHGLLQCEDYSALEATLTQLLDQPELGAKMGENAFQVIKQQPDILNHYLKCLASDLSSKA